MSEPKKRGRLSLALPAALGLLGLLLALELLLIGKPKPHGWWDSFLGGYALTGTAGALVWIGTAKWLSRNLLGRPKDYYGEDS